MRHSSLALPGFAFASLYEEVGSTMDVARGEVPTVAGSAEGAGLVVARRQLAGRGRQGRSWSGTGGAFMGTFLFSTRMMAAELTGYSLSIGVGISSALEELGVPVRLKWPNDIVVVRAGDLNKLGGILIEVQESDGVRVVLVGIGLNLVEAPADVPRALSARAVSGIDLSVEHVAGALGASLRSCHERFVGQGGFASFRSEWEERSCFVPGQTALAIEVSERTVRGIYSGIEESGALLITRGTTVEALHSGHILSAEGLR